MEMCSFPEEMEISGGWFAETDGDNPPFPPPYRKPAPSNLSSTWSRRMESWSMSPTCRSGLTTASNPVGLPSPTPPSATTGISPGPFPRGRFGSSISNCHWSGIIGHPLCGSKPGSWSKLKTVFTDSVIVGMMPVGMPPWLVKRGWTSISKCKPRRVR